MILAGSSKEEEALFTVPNLLLHSLAASLPYTPPPPLHLSITE